jgi:urea transport system ATP-binding protein
VSEKGSIIYLEGVVVDYDGFKALDNLNFFVNYNELRVVIGPNGAGKTTLLDVICGKTSPRPDASFSARTSI